VLIVDGHSIIFAWPDLRELHSRPASRVSAREMLLRRLVNYQDTRGVRVVVVFDGQGDKATDDSAGGPGVQVFYAARGQTADAIIERLVASYAETYDITVATCDSLERQTVITLGGSTIDADRLARMLEETDEDLRNQLEKLRKRR
jgi:predicted RNA-binding protein with PIN domain